MEDRFQRRAVAPAHRRHAGGRDEDVTAESVPGCGDVGPQGSSRGVGRESYSFSVRSLGAPPAVVAGVAVVAAGVRGAAVAGLESGGGRR